jgi:hypothetical protein
MSTSARLILGLAMSLIAPATNPGSPLSTVVIAELFTSEGCSSCPPADTLMRQLADAQPLDGAHLIAGFSALAVEPSFRPGSDQ